MTSLDRPRVFRDAQLFKDALSGVDGTHAIRERYQAPPVYPDASLWVLEGRPGRVESTGRPAVTVSRAVADQLAAAAELRAAAVNPLAARPAAAPARPAPSPAARATRPAVAPQRPARRVAPLAAGGVVSAPYALPSAPSRQDAARAGHYQGPVPNAVAPAAATRHNMPMSYAPQQQAAVFLPSAQPARPGIAPRAAAPGPSPAAPWSPTQPAAPLARRPTVPPPQATPPQQAPLPPALPGQRWQTRPVPNAKKRSSWIQVLIFLVIFVLVTSGAGTRILDALQQLFQR